MQLSNITNWRQQRDGECLAACAAMVLRHLGEHVSYERILQRLGTSEAGTPFSNIDYLHSTRVKIERATGTIEIVRLRISEGMPVIVPVATELLPYWLIRTDLPIEQRMVEHAVVVIGIDNANVYVNDPDFDMAPQVVDIGWFEESWRHHDSWYAVIEHR